MARVVKVRKNYRIAPSVLNNISELIEQHQKVAEEIGVRLNETQVIELAVQELYRRAKEDKQYLKKIISA